MESKRKTKIWTLTMFFLFNAISMFGQQAYDGKLQGYIQIDSSWSPNVYLSYLPTFSDIHSMSSEMIIAESKIDSLGFFEFDLDFLPKEQKLYRLHVSKMEDSKTSLIIGGFHENYIAFIANRASLITLKSTVANPPFKNVIFDPKSENSKFQKITNLVFKKDSIASISGRSKRKFIEERRTEELLNIADSSTNVLVSLYAIHKSNFESNYVSNEKFYKSYLRKWSNIDNNYFREFRTKLPFKEPKNNWPVIISMASVLLIAGFFLGKYGLFKDKRIQKLTVQERKIFNLLKLGATNKEISEEFNIGLSTVKTHVSSILNKLNLKSRKEVMDLKQ